HQQGRGGRRLVASPHCSRPPRPAPCGGQPGGGGYDGATMLEVLDQARLLVVTGKGGTGKTTVAGGLAGGAAGRGRRGGRGPGAGRGGPGCWGGGSSPAGRRGSPRGSTRWPSTPRSRCGSTWTGTGSRSDSS